MAILLDQRHPKQLKRAFVVAFLACICACSPESRQAKANERLIGKWRLVSLGGRPVQDTAVREWSVTFTPDGKWRYAGWLKGKWQGMHLSGAGRWKLTKSTLEYTAGDASGAAVIAVSASELTLTPDPVLTSPRGGNPIMSTYRRE